MIGEMNGKMETVMSAPGRTRKNALAFQRQGRSVRSIQQYRHHTWANSYSHSILIH